MLCAPAACNVRHAYLVRCLFGKTRSRHRCAPNAGMRCGLPASSRQCGRCLGWSSTYAEAADTSEPPNASPIPHHRSGFNRRAAYDIPCSVPALANAGDPNMDDQPKTRLICRRCAARMKLARRAKGFGPQISSFETQANRERDMMSKSLKLPKGQLDLSAALFTASMIAMSAGRVVDIFLCAAKMMTRGRLRSMQQDPVSRLRGCPSPRSAQLNGDALRDGLHHRSSIRLSNDLLIWPSRFERLK